MTPEPRCPGALRGGRRRFPCPHRSAVGSAVRSATRFVVRLPSPLALLCIGVLAAACAPEPAGPVPSAPQVESYYIYPPGLEASVDDGVAELRVVQPSDQLERGGRLWARAGPYVFLFSEETRSLFQDYPGLQAVRVVTRTPEGEEVARAFLHRQGLTGIGWQRALNIAGRARTEGTQRPTRLEELVRWGEEHTDFEYAPRFEEQD